MRLVSRITVSFILPLVLVLGLWGFLSYKTMERKVHADTDLILTDYSDGIVMRMLSGDELPPRFNGVYNTYYIAPVDEKYAASNPPVSYYESEAHLASQQDFASSRVRKQIFKDADGQNYEIAVSLPTFEQEVLVEHVMGWTILLFFILLVAMIIISYMVVKGKLKPLKQMLKWIDEYRPGTPVSTFPESPDIYEFRKLSGTITDAVRRFELMYEEKSVFIGNAAHELQTPLAACSNRLEVLLNRPDLTEEMAEELFKLEHSLQGLIRLNKSLLLLTRIESNQYSELSEIDLLGLVNESVANISDIYSHKGIEAKISYEEVPACTMNNEMASVLVNNLVKNAFVHTAEGGQVDVILLPDGFSVSNTGDQPLDESRVFQRFYKHDRSSGDSNGLGLAMVKSVCESFGFDVRYEFCQNRHKFSVVFNNSK